MVKKASRRQSAKKSNVAGTARSGRAEPRRSTKGKRKAKSSKSKIPKRERPPVGIHERLFELISSERDRFEDQHNNMVAFAFSEIGRYRRYLDLVSERHKVAAKDLVDNTNAMREMTKPGTHPVTPAMWTRHEDAGRIIDRLHMDIETFYLFAKILLDKVARAIEFYFGKGKAQSLHSHDKLAKNLRAFAEQKGLQIDPELFPRIDEGCDRQSALSRECCDAFQQVAVLS
jgi:hypothetical protein